MTLLSTGLSPQKLKIEPWAVCSMHVLLFQI